MNLNKIVYILLVCAVRFTHVSMANTNHSTSPNIKLVDKLVQLVDDELNNNILEHFHMTQVLYEFEHESDSFWPLVEATTNNWIQVVENFDSIVSNDDERVILLHAFLFLPPDEYIEFLYHALDLYKTKRITHHELYVLAICPPNNKRWLLSYNYQDPAVINFLNSFEKTIAGDTDLENATEFIRNGKAKKRDQFLRKNKTEKYYEMNSVPILNARHGNDPILLNESEEKDAFSLNPYIYFGVLIILIGGIGYYCFRKRF